MVAIANDSDAVARDLAAAEQRRRRGAELVVPHLRWWWYLMVCLAFGAWGFQWEAPAAWRWVPLLAFAAVVIPALLLARGRAARPLPIRLGWRHGLLIAGVAVAGIAAALGVGVGLRALAVPFPFTVGGLLLGAGVSLLVPWSRRWRASYVERVARGPW